jgi:poly(3-hydroxybutyrate) depolymerase
MPRRGISTPRALRALALLATVAVLPGCGGAPKRPETGTRPTATGGVRVWTIGYRAHDGRARAAYVVAPAWYGPRRNPPLPLVVSPHGRGVDGRANARLWGGLPARGRFVVVSPDGEGDHLPLYSWGATGQVDDLAAMPRLARAALSWLRVARGRVYAVGGSMGGQEVLLLVARAPHLLAGAVAFDAPTDFAEQYARFPQLPCNAACLRRWKDPIGLGLQELARKEVGGTPKELPAAYTARSPVRFSAPIARSRVPLQLWWSTRDVVVPAEEQRRFVVALTRAGAGPRVMVIRGTWAHVSGMRVNLPEALRRLGLLGRATETG